MAISCRKHTAILMVRVVASAQKKNQGLNSFSELPTTIATEIATQTLIVIGETCLLDVSTKSICDVDLLIPIVPSVKNGYCLVILRNGMTSSITRIIIWIKIFL